MVGAFCLGTNLVERRRLRRTAVFLVGVVFLAVVADLDVCFFVVAALSVHAGAQNAKNNKIKKVFFIYIGTLSAVACDARPYGAATSGFPPPKRLHPRVPRLNLSGHEGDESGNPAAAVFAPLSLVEGTSASQIWQFGERSTVF